MSISMTDVAGRLKLEDTILFLGSGSSIPSGGPSVSDLISHFGLEFNIPECKNYSLSEIASIVEIKYSRRDMIRELRKMIEGLKPTGSIINMPLINWRAIYTTNYDTLVEQAYSKHSRSISIKRSNFDFRSVEMPDTVKLFKLHESIEEDESDGKQSRIIITEEDYERAHEYREALYNTLENQLYTSDIVIVGYSLSDSHIRDIINRVNHINKKSNGTATIYLIMYEEDVNRAMLYESRAIKVVYGSLDTLILKLIEHNSYIAKESADTGNLLDLSPVLRTVTLDVEHSRRFIEKNAASMFNGWPATYADIDAQLTFDRTLREKILDGIDKEKNQYAILLGPSGTGKSTLARQVMIDLLGRDYHCWEHKNKHAFVASEWRKLAKTVSERKESSILFVDDAHLHIYELNELIDMISADESHYLYIIMTTSGNQWYPRTKTPNLFKNGTAYEIEKLDSSEIDRLLALMQSQPDFQPLVEKGFAGFSWYEKKRRLTDKCESDTFVCLKSIFASEKFDDIVLREYAELNESEQIVYKVLSAMESSGIIVHRQLLIKMLGINADSINAILVNLHGIVHETEISRRDGIYGWAGRHRVITGIISDYKYKKIEEYEQLYDKVIDCLMPAYEIEVRTMKQLCAFDNGINRIPEKQKRNRLLRKIISKAPGERVPRHRLIRNLIDMNELGKAATEIRLFENDFFADGPVQKYNVKLLIARAEKTDGILDEDRLAILEKAREKAILALGRYSDNIGILSVYCDVGISIFKISGEQEVYREAIDRVKDAEERIGDPQITKVISRKEQKMRNVENGY